VKKRLRCDFAATVPYEPVSNLVHVSRMFRRVREGGGEGLILRRPGAGYSTSRVNDVLEIKNCPITGDLACVERRRYPRAAA
jgi:ATP-dependent DNA ligase